MKNLLSIFLICALLTSCKTFYIMPITYAPKPRETWRAKEFKRWNDPTYDVYIEAINGNSVSFKFLNKKIANTINKEKISDFKRTYDRYKAAGMVCILQRRHTKNELAAK